MKQMNLNILSMLSFIGMFTLSTFAFGDLAKPNSRKRIHILRISSGDSDGCGWGGTTAQHYVKSQATYLGAKWTDIQASSISDLRQRLLTLKQNAQLDEPITNVLFNGHGWSREDAFGMMVGEESLWFRSGQEESNPLTLLRGHVAPHAKIFFGGCNVFDGTISHVRTRAKVLAKVLGSNDFEVFASDHGHFPLLSVFPPLNLDRHLPQRFFRLAVYSTFIRVCSAALFVLHLRERQAPNTLPHFLYFVGWSTYVTTMVGLAPTILAYKAGNRHEGYLVLIQDGKISVEHLPIDIYLYHRFLG